MQIKFSSQKSWTASTPRARLIAGRVIVAVGFGSLIAGAWMAVSTARFTRAAVAAVGTVTEISEDSNTGDRSPTYAPVFSFTTQDGQVQSVLSHISSNPPSYAVGDKVPVLYLPDHPAKARIDSFWQLWFFPIFLAGFGLVAALIGAVFLYLAGKPGPIRPPMAAAVS